MGVPGDSWYLNGVLFFVGALLVGIVMIATAAAIGGYTNLLLKEELVATGLSLVPFAFIGISAGLASKQGIIVGCCAWFGGFLCVGVLQLLSCLDYQQAMKNHAWTGAALTRGLFIFAAIPASLIGSTIGRAIGRRFASGRTTG